MPSSTVRLQQRLANRTLELLRIPSVTGEERDITHHLERWALTLPHVAEDDIIRINNNLIVGGSDQRRPTIALIGHLDTVPPHPSDDAPNEDAARIYGRGASDMKGGLAVMQMLYEDLELERLPFALMLVFYEREEGPYEESGLGPLLDLVDTVRDIDLAVILEPTDNTLQVGCLGTLHAHLTIRGKTAHSARPWEGENAIHRAGELLSRLHRLPPREVEIDGLIFRETTSITSAHGGRARNVIPDTFELNLNHRFAARESAAVAMREAIDAVRRLAPEAEVEITDVAPPGPVPFENPLVDHLQQQGFLEVRAKEAWTDVGRLASFNIDAVNFGPGATSQAHQAGEWVEKTALLRCYQVLSRFLSTELAAWR